MHKLFQAENGPLLQAERYPSSEEGLETCRGVTNVVHLLAVYSNRHVGWDDNLTLQSAEATARDVRW